MEPGTYDRLPEGVPEREQSTGSAADFLPARHSLAALRTAAAGCRGCHLWTCGTQTVFGQGPRDARVMLVGEQPGDAEDREGRPFVGPSGRLLDEALAAAGIDRDTVYVTNAVKHFKWERSPRGSKRLHKKPNDREMRACFPWLDQEIAAVRPQVIVALGATAARALIGKQFRVTQGRGRAMESTLADVVFATVHPSAVLRAPSGQREAAERAFVADVKKVAKWLAAHERDREVRRAVKRAD
jgi:DNA polymerase